MYLKLHNVDWYILTLAKLHRNPLDVVCSILLGQLLICSRPAVAAKTGDWMKPVTCTMYVTAGGKVGFSDYFAAWRLPWPQCILFCSRPEMASNVQGAANKSNPLPCFVNML